VPLFQGLSIEARAADLGVMIVALSFDPQQKWRTKDVTWQMLLIG
jgi:hypothetical protein